jgi:hypothetical protein
MSAEGQARVRQAVHEWFIRRGYPDGLDHFSDEAVAARQRARKEQRMRDEQIGGLVDLKGLQELRDALAVAATQADKAARQYLAKTQALKGPKASKTFQDSYRTRRMADAKAEAQQMLRAHNVPELCERGTAALAMEAQLTSPDFFLSRARFVVGAPEPVFDDDTSERSFQRKHYNLLQKVAAGQLRDQWREELHDADDDDLRGYIAQCKATSDAALLRLIDREIRTRVKEGRDVPVDVKATALPEAKQAILATAPEPRAALGLLAEIKRSLGRLADADQTIVTGEDHHIKEGAARAKELADEHGDEGTEIYVAEVAERRRQLDREATVLAEKEIARAIAADEADAAPFAIPISDNPSPRLTRGTETRGANDNGN